MKMKAKAVVFEDVRKVVVKDIDLPSPTAKDIVVELEVSGVSVGTERWALIGKRAEISFPNVPGYMGIGRVSAVGAEARGRGYAEGERVNFFASRMAPPYEGRSWMASHLSHAVVDVCTGVDWDPAGMNVHRCEKLPQGLDPLDASLCGLCAVALRGIEMAGIPAAAKVLVCGLGVIGQYAAQVCRLKGALVAVTDVVETRLGLAAKLGADWVIHGKKENLAERAAAIAPNGFDVIIDTSSIPAVVNSLFPLLKMYGKFIFQGWYPPPSALDLNAFHMRLPTCFFPCAHTGVSVATAMRLTAANKLNTRDLITHVVKPEEAPAIYKMIAAGSDQFLGVVFDWRK